MPITLTKNPNTFNFKIRHAESFNHTIRISKPFGSIDCIVEWCKSEITDEWRWEVIQTSSIAEFGEYIFYFDSESDYLAFVLKWK